MIEIPSCCNSSESGFEPESVGAEPAEGANL